MPVSTATPSPCCRTTACWYSTATERRRRRPPSSPRSAGARPRGEPPAHESARALDRQLALALGSLVRDRDLRARLPRRAHRRARKDPRADDGAGARVQPSGPRDAAAELPEGARAARRCESGAEADSRGGSVLSRTEVPRTAYLSERHVQRPHDHRARRTAYRGAELRPRRHAWRRVRLSAPRDTAAA